MAIEKTQFSDATDHANKNVFDSYFHLKNVSRQEGGHRFKKLGSQESGYSWGASHINMKELLKNTAKIISYFTVIIPLIMLIGKAIHDYRHHYKIIKELPSDKIKNVSAKILNKTAGDEGEKEIMASPEVSKLSESSRDGKAREKDEEDLPAAEAALILNIIKDLKEKLQAEEPALIDAQTEEHGIKIQKGELEGIEFEINSYGNYGITVWKITREGQAYEVNEYAPQAYHGPKTEGFIERQRLLIDAAKWHVKNLAIGDSLEGQKAQEKMLETLDYLQRNFMQEIRSEKFLIDPQYIQHPDKKVGEDHYMQVHGIAQELLAQLAKDIQFTVNQLNQVAELKMEEFTIDKLAQAEKDFIVAVGRPTIINTYFLGDSNQQFFHMQKPSSIINEKGERMARAMLPSTVRDREGLANYVATSFGEIHYSEGEDFLETLFDAIRHSSYPPIAIKDTLQRQAIGCRNCKQNLIDLTALRIQADPSLVTAPNRPLVLPLRTMMLLSPKKIDKMRNRKKGIAGKWSGESETTQLEESALALKIYNQRLLKVRIEGKDVWIKPDISFMNLGANELAVNSTSMGKHLKDAESLASYNAKGFIEFEQEVFDFLHKQSILPPSLTVTLQEIESMKGAPSLRQAKMDMQAIQNEKAKEIISLYASLDRLMEKYLSHPGKPDLKREIIRLKDKIEQHEKEVYNHYKDYLRLKSEVYIQKSSEIRNLFKKFRSQLKREIDQLPSDLAKVQQLQHINDLTLKFELATDVFYHQKNKEVNSVLDFQVNYLEIHAMMSNCVEFFCKSAEDRTGRVDDKIQENKAFQAIFGRVPFGPEDQDYIDKFISPLIHQYSVSQNNTEKNSGARGEQISPLLNPHLHAKIDKKHAYLAKNVINKARKKKPSAHVRKKLFRLERKNTKNAARHGEQMNPLLHAHTSTKVNKRRAYLSKKVISRTRKIGSFLPGKKSPSSSARKTVY
jgi:gas vesicle protein